MTEDAPTLPSQACRRRIPWGARLLLLLAVVTWAWMRWPLVEQFAWQASVDARLVVASDAPMYLAMADALLRHGQLGEYDAGRPQPLAALARWDSDYRTLPETAPPRFQPLDYNDWGWSVVVAVSWLWPWAPQNLWTILIGQLMVDVTCLMGICWIGMRLVSPWAGAVCALLYALHPSLASLACNPYYYYWSVPTTISALALWVGLYRDAAPVPLKRAVIMVTLTGLAIGTGAWIRGTNGTLLPILGLALLARERLTKRTLILGACLVVATLVPLLPNAVLKFRHHGHFQFRAKEIFWHTVLCGLGNYDNPWGLKWDDGVAFERIRQKYGISYSIERAREYDEACHQEVLSLWREDPSIFVRNLRRNLSWGLAFRSAIPPDQDRDPVHRLLNRMRTATWLGFLALLALGRRRGLPYWALLMMAMMLVPVLQIAPICRPVYNYISGMFPLEPLLAGAGLTLAVHAAWNWMRRHLQEGTDPTADE